MAEDRLRLAGQKAGAALPNLVIIGVEKAATSSLFTYLDQHPDICGSTLKDIQHFSPLMYPDGELPQLKGYQRTFRHCSSARYMMDATANYWCGGDAVRAAMEQILPRPRYVISLRDPVERFWSEYTYKRSRLLLPENMTVDRYLDRCVELYRSGEEFARSNRYYRALAFGRYAEHLSAWFDSVGDRLLVVFFEDLVADTPRVVTDVVAWLGLETAAVEGFDFSRQNETIEHRSDFVQRGAYRLRRSVFQFLDRAPKLRDLAFNTYRSVNSTGLRKTSLDPAVRQRLEALYAPMVGELLPLLRLHGYERLPSWLCRGS